LIICQDNEGIETIEIINDSNINTMKLVSKSVHINGHLKGKFIKIEADIIIVDGTVEIIS
jgi:hypothetical protein